jgi:hypothetical protein
VYSKTLSCVFEQEKIHVDSTSSFSVYVCANMSHVRFQVDSFTMGLQLLKLSASHFKAKLCLHDPLSCPQTHLSSDDFRLNQVIESYQTLIQGSSIRVLCIEMPVFLRFLKPDISLKAAETGCFGM